MKHIFAFILLSSFAFTACDGIFKSDDCSNCEVNCTEEFKMIAIDVVDTDGNPVELNDYKITYKKSGDDVNTNQNDQLVYGKYILATDAMMEDLACDGTKITFSYSLDSKTYNNETFLIGKDCCHILWKDDKSPRIIID
jgi:hypothetical protein